MSTPAISGRESLVLTISWIFGLLMVAYSLFVTLETITRKLLKFSFQGADELGGYALAIGGGLSFTVALIERGHIRIDLLHDRTNVGVRAWLNWLSTMSLAGFGLFIMRYAWGVIRDTMAYGSTAPTAWSTPMIYPQSVWYATLLLFGMVSVMMAVSATLLLLRRDVKTLNERFDPKGALDELSDELDDFDGR